MTLPTELDGQDVAASLAWLRQEEKKEQKGLKKHGLSGSFYGFLYEESRKVNLIAALRAGDSFAERREAYFQREKAPSKKLFDKFLTLFCNTFGDVDSLTDTEMVERFECCVAVVQKADSDLQRETEKAHAREFGIFSIENRFKLGYFAILAVIGVGISQCEFSDTDSPFEEYCRKYKSNYPFATEQDCRRAWKEIQDFNP